MNVIVTDSGNGINEDIGSSISEAAWVLDGATGVGEVHHTPGTTDAQWYVQRLDRSLRNHVSDVDTELAVVVKDSVRKIANDFAKHAEGDFEKINPEAKPSAAGAIARWDSSTLELFVIADCSVIILFTDGRSLRITDTRPYLNRLEREAELGKYRLMVDQGATESEARDLIWPKLVDDRRKLRTSPESWALCLNPRAAEDGKYARFSVDSVQRIYLCSDGFSRLVDKFGEFDSWKEAIERISDVGVEQSLRRLRTIERSDSDCTLYPRIKTHDDATVVTTDTV